MPQQGGNGLRFEWVELLNFKLYRGQHRFEFPQTPGLYLLAGKNLVHPRLGSNDVGKTSLLDAVFWAFFGRTPRGLRAGDVICRGESTAEVAVSFRIGHDKHIVTRRQTPNALTLNDTPISQETLFKTPPLTDNQYLHSLLYPHFGEAVFDLAPALKLVLFSEIMRLEFWLEKSEQAAAEAAELIT